MATTAGKFWYAVAALAFVGVFLYGFPAGGEWFGSLVLGSLATSALLLGVLASATRDGDVAAGAAPDVAARSALPAGWPALAAVGGGVTIVGLAGGNALFYAGLGVLGVVLVEWMVQGWAERSSADPAYNSELRSRIMSPIEIPLVAVVVIGVFLASLSRVLLAVSENGSRVIAIAVATTILLIAFLVAYRPRVGSSILSGMLALGAVVLIAVGIVSGVAGERDFGHHESGKTGSESHSTPAANP
jgi:hypothetical protein